MKGYAIIELTNVNTGEKEVYEEENIVTNGLQNFLGVARQLWQINSGGDRCMYPIYCNALGGIVLFNQQITESMESTEIPDTFTKNNIVGYSAYSTDGTSDTKRGILNTTETVIEEKRAKYVYDFGTDKANGMIQCISLCPSKYGLMGAPYLKGGRIGYLPYIKDGKNVSRKGQIIKFNFLVGKGYSAAWNGNGIDLYEIILSGYMNNVNFTEFGLNENLLIHIEIPEETSGYYCFAGEGDYIYGFKKNGKNIYIVKIDINTYGYEQSTVVLSEDKGTGMEILGIKRGYIYARIYSTYDIYFLRINIQTGEVKDILGTSYGNSYYYKHDIFMLRNGDFYFDGRIFPLDDTEEYGTEYVATEPYSYNCEINNGFAFCRRDDGAVCHTYDVLGTVNNLATPVRKTAAQTMKITYTLTME